MTPEDDDIDRWIAELSGAKRSSGAETMALRQAIAGHAAREQAGDRQRDAADEHAWQQLRFRLRREGLLRADRPAWRDWLPATAAAAVLAALILPVALQDPRGFDVTLGDPPIVRGVEDRVLAGPNPLARAQLLARQLSGHGAKPALYFQDGTATLDFELDTATIDAAEQQLHTEVPGLRLRVGFNRLVLRAQR